MKIAHFVPVSVFTLILVCCQDADNITNDIALSSTTANTSQPAINTLDKAYWYSGKAEVTTYRLSQNRYNAVHDGELVNIFVTEDFLTDRQVKNDNYTNPNSVPVLKMNQIRRFTTGVYDYSMMTSVFTRADGSVTEKITLSSQDWCGQSFVQLNKIGKKYSFQIRSYFEAEGDLDFQITADLLEDELLNLIRIDPNKIPEGSVSIFPSLTYLRFSHGTHEPQKAVITKGDYSGKDFQGDNLKVIQIQFDDLDRTLEIVYDPSTQNKIVSWNETRRSAFDSAERTTVVSPKGELYDAYWRMNGKSDTGRRNDLDLPSYD